MKYIKKAFLATLSIFTLTAGVFGISSCDDKTQTLADTSIESIDDTEVRKIYATYVEHTQAQGEIPLTYEQWLMTIRGEDGKDGVGIEKVEYDADGNLVITFTNGTAQTVALPEQNEHVHTFGDWIPFMDNETSCDGKLFFRVCSDCNGVEWKQGAYADHDWATEYSYNQTEHWIDCNACADVKDKAEHTADGTGCCAVCQEPIFATQGLIYTLSDDGTSYAISGYQGTDSEVRLPSAYKGLPVTKIADKAFLNCKRLTGVEIPASITTIGISAFEGCKNLSRVVIPDSVTHIDKWAFYECFSLTELTFGNSLEIIGVEAFAYCSALTSLQFPDSLTEIQWYAFSYCSALEQVQFGKGLTTIGDEAFFNCPALTKAEIPAGVTRIGRYAFSLCNNLVSAVIPNTVTVIDDHAFENSDALTTVYYTGTASEWNAMEINTDFGSARVYYYSHKQPIGEGNFWHFVDGEITIWENLTPSDGLAYTLSEDGVSYLIAGIGTCTDTDIVIAPTYDGLPVSGIAVSAFETNDTLTSVAIPDSVTTIGKWAFYDCTALENVSFGNSMETIGVEAFAYCSALTSVEIPDSVKEIEWYAFSYCPALTQVQLGNGVTTLGDEVFFECPNLQNIVMGNSVETIGRYTFSACPSLTSIVLPKTLVSVEDHAFHRSALANVYYMGTESEWNAIVFDTDNEKLLEATRYYYSETQPTEDGNFWHYVDGEIVVW